MLVRLSCLVVVIALAGCSDGGGADDTAPDDSSSTPTSGAPGTPAAQSVPELVSRHLDWNGSLVAGAWVCENTVTDDCTAQPAGAFGTHYVFEDLLGNVTTGSLTLEWTPVTAVTQQLVMEASVFTPNCEDCNSTMLSGAVGTSPLTVELVGRTFAPGEVLFVAVYNNQYATAGSAGAAGTSGDQDFRVSGDVTLLA